MDARLEEIERLAWLLDSSIRIPVINYRVGIDGLLGLIPGIGDFVGLILSSYVWLRGVMLGVSVRTTFVMAFNILVETIVGLIPFLGDLFDFVWKANERNLHLIKRDLGYHSEPPSQKGLIALVLFAGLFVMGLLFLIAWAIVALVRWLI